MYIIPPEPNKVLNENFKSWMEKGGVKKVLNEMKSDIIWPEIKYGEFIIFSPNLFHGSIVNDTTETRWSLNSRLNLYLLHTHLRPNILVLFMILLQQNR